MQKRHQGWQALSLISDEAYQMKYMTKFLGLALYMVGILTAVTAYYDPDYSAFMPVLILITTFPLILGAFLPNKKTD